MSQKHPPGTAAVAAAQTGDDELLSPKQVCERWRAAFPNPQALAERRWRGTGPDYVKTAPGRSGRVLYRASAITRWLDARTVSSGGAAA